MATPLNIAITSVPSGAPAAPILTLITSSSTPDLDVACGQPPIVGDIFHWRVNGARVSDITFTSDHQINGRMPLGVSNLATGTNIIDVAHQSGGKIGAISNAVVVVV